MLVEWLNNNDIKKTSFNTPLFPKAADRAYWDKRYDPKIVEACEEFLGYEWPMIRATDYLELAFSGNRRKQEIPHFARRRALISLIVAEVLEYKGRFLPDIVDGIFVVCEETFWGLSAHMSVGDLTVPHIPPYNVPCIDLFAAETAEIISVARYMLADALAEYCPDLLKRIDYELDSRIIKPYLANEDWAWMGKGSWINNWNPWIISNLLTVFLLRDSRDEEFYRGVTKTMTEINRYYRSLPADGGCDEGASYWREGAGKLFEFCNQLYLATDGRIDLFNDKKMHNVAIYGYATYIGEGQFITFSDYGQSFSCSEHLYYTFGHRVGADGLKSFAKEYYALRSVGLEEDPLFKGDRCNKIKEALWWLMHKAEILNAPDYIPPEHICFPDLQVAVHRNDSWYYAVKGGHNEENHNHNDVGSFIAYHNNSPLLIDPGCPVYTAQTHSKGRYGIWTMQGQWHNIPVLNGVQQVVGIQYKADSFEDKEDQTAISFASAYSKEAEVKELSRTIKLKNDGIILNDTFEFSGRATSVCENFVTPLCVTVEKNSVLLGEKYILSADTDCEITLLSMDISDDFKLSKLWKVKTLNRISFTFSKTDVNFVLKEK